MQLSQSGRYDEAIEGLESINIASQSKALKLNQYLVLCVGIIKLKRAIRRYDLMRSPCILSNWF